MINNSYYFLQGIKKTIYIHTNNFNWRKHEAINNFINFAYPVYSSLLSADIAACKFWMAARVGSAG
jgi:hypothetical protein